MTTKILVVLSLVVAFVLLAPSEGKTYLINNLQNLQCCDDNWLSLNIVFVKGRYTKHGYGHKNGGCACAAYYDPVCGVNGRTYSNIGCLGCAYVVINLSKQSLKSISFYSKYMTIKYELPGNTGLSAVWRVSYCTNC